jgi:hypothetical protein
MSTGDLIDDDPDVGAAVEKILARGASALGDEPTPDVRENREDREPHEMAEDADMDDRPDPVETEGKNGAEQAAEGDEQFLEIPGETDDADPIRVPMTEAAEAVKQIRQMNGDIAAAVIRAETEAEEKSQQLISATAETYRQVRTTAEAAVRLMQQFLPQPPDRSMLDERSENYDPQRFYALKAYHDEYVAHAQKIHATIAQATQGEAGVMSEAEKLEIERETRATARYIPEWSKPETREAKKAEILAPLKAKYGLTDEDVAGITSHKAWRILADHAKTLGVEAKAPEIRKTVQEKAAKIVNGKMPARDPNGTGRFIGRDREELRKTGSVDAAARLFMKSGLTKAL